MMHGVEIKYLAVDTRQEPDESITEYWSALYEGEMIGQLRYDPDGYVLSVFVKEAFRGEGVGSLLLETAEAHAISQKVKVMGVSVNKKNEGAIRLYEKKGYLKFMPHNDQKYVQYVKPLVAPLPADQM